LPSCPFRQLDNGKKQQFVPNRAGTSAAARLANSALVAAAIALQNRGNADRESSREIRGAAHVFPLWFCKT
jgi:hypothetical protein